MSKIRGYIKSRTMGWWLTTALLLIILALIVSPKLRYGLYDLISGDLPEPEIESATSYPKLRENAYSFNFRDMENNEFYLYEFRDQVVFLNFWATWCRPCILEMESIEELYKDYGDRVKFIIFSNQNKKVVQEAIEKLGYDLPYYYAWKNRPPELNPDTFPTTIIISSGGEVVLSHEGAANWNTPEVRKLLDKLLEG